MRFAKLMLAVAVIAVVLTGLAAPAQAAGGNEACLVTSFAELKNADKIKGSAQVSITNWAGPNNANSADSVSATLTLTYKNTTAIFQATDNNPGIIVSPEAVMCGILDLNPTTTTADTIFTVFGIQQKSGAPHETLKLCLVVQPKTQTVLCQSLDKLDLTQIGTSNNWTAIIDKLTIYVIP
jgi:hypothetical protein